MATEREWQEVLRTVQGLSREFDNDIIAIGGVAVALHSHGSRVFTEKDFTHDADVYVSSAAWPSFRDEFDVVLNRRLSKSQTKIGKVEVDLYVEYGHSLRFEFEELAHASTVIKNVRVAGLEHILLLKLDAYDSRRHSEHGKKDRRDIAKILILLENSDPSIVLAAASKKDIRILEEIMRSQVFFEIAHRNAHLARKLKDKAEVFLEALSRR